MTLRQRLHEVRARLGSGFLSDPTHISLGVLALVVGASLVMSAHLAKPIPPFLMYGWALGLGVAGVGKIVGPFLYQNPAREATARALLFASSILAATCWGTIAIGLIFLGPGATLGVLQAVALTVGAVGRAEALRRNTQSVSRHARSGGLPQ